MCLMLLFPQPSGGLLSEHQWVSCPHLPQAPGVWGVDCGSHPGGAVAQGLFTGTGCRGKESTTFSAGAYSELGRQR